jgi:acetolactate synthase-1/3 small subunit
MASLVRRRGYNIESLTVGPTETAEISRITLVIDANAVAASRIEAQLYKLVHVRRVAHVTDVPSVCRDLALIKVSAEAASRGQIVQLADVFRARVVDVGSESIVIEITGTEDKIDGLIDVLRPFGVIEIARTGRLTMTRGTAQATVRRVRPAATVEDSLPCSA